MNLFQSVNFIALVVGWAVIAYAFCYGIMMLISASACLAYGWFLHDLFEWLDAKYAPKEKQHEPNTAKSGR